MTDKQIMILRARLKQEYQHGYDAGRHAGALNSEKFTRHEETILELKEAK